MTLHSGELEALKHFSDACRIELRKYSAYVQSPLSKEGLEIDS